VGGIAKDVEAIRHRRLPAIGGDHLHFARCIVLEAVEGTLQSPVNDLALAQRHTAMNALIAQATHAPRVIAPEDQLLSHPRHANGLIFDLIGVHHHVPLIGNHRCASP